MKAKPKNEFGSYLHVAVQFGQVEIFEIIFKQLKKEKYDWLQLFKREQVRTRKSKNSKRLDFKNWKLKIWVTKAKNFLRVHNFTFLRKPESFCNGLSIKTSRLNHSCKPNAVNSANAVNSEFNEVRAIRNIKAGQEITISYKEGPGLFGLWTTQIFVPMAIRQTVLRKYDHWSWQVLGFRINVNKFHTLYRKKPSRITELFWVFIKFGTYK